MVDIPDDDASKQSEGKKEGANELPREPKEEPVETATFGGSIFGVDSDIVCEGVPNSPVLLLTGECTAEGYVSGPPAASAIYVLGWGITRESRISQHEVAYDWGSLATIEALELLSNSHLSNNLLYASAQVGSYKVATASHLRQSGSSSGELALIKADRGELKARLRELEGGSYC